MIEGVSGGLGCCIALLVLGICIHFYRQHVTAVRPLRIPNGSAGIGETSVSPRPWLIAAADRVSHSRATIASFVSMPTLNDSYDDNDSIIVSVNRPGSAMNCGSLPSAIVASAHDTSPSSSVQSTTSLHNGDRDDRHPSIAPAIPTDSATNHTSLPSYSYASPPPYGTIPRRQNPPWDSEPLPPLYHTRGNRRAK